MGGLFFLSRRFFDFFVAFFALLCSPVQVGAYFLSSWELVLCFLACFFVSVFLCCFGSSILVVCVALCLWLVKLSPLLILRCSLPVHKVVASRCSSEMKARTSWAHPSAGLHTS